MYNSYNSPITVSAGFQVKQKLKQGSAIRLNIQLHWQKGSPLCDAKAKVADLLGLRAKKVFELSSTSLWQRKQPTNRSSGTPKGGQLEIALSIHVKMAPSKTHAQPAFNPTPGA